MRRHALTLTIGTMAGLWLLLGMGAAPAAAGTGITVNSNLDLPDADLLDGVPDADLAIEGQQVTLRAAIQHANATPGTDTIVLPSGIFPLTLQGSLEDAAATGDLDVAEDLVIQGDGVLSTIIDGKKAKDRIFEVLPGIDCTITNLTIARGSTVEGDDDGGGIRATNGASLNLDEVIVSKCDAAGDGGGISLQQASATITDTWISKNKSGDDAGGMDMDPDPLGATLTLERVTFSRNKAKDHGGGMVNSGGIVTITNCTFSGNKAKEEGGALFCSGGGITTLLSCTLAKNKAKEGSGIHEAVEDDPDTINVGHTIVSNKKTTNYSGDGMTSDGHNIDSGTTCGFGATGDLADTNPQLLKLADNGGSTPTQGLKPTSPALDVGDDLLAPEFDQRGLPRVDLPDVGTDAVLADIGAFERQEP